MVERVILTKEEQSAMRIFRDTYKPNVTQVYTFNYHDERIVPAILRQLGFERFCNAYYVGYNVYRDEKGADEL